MLCIPFRVNLSQKFETFADVGRCRCQGFLGEQFGCLCILVALTAGTIEFRKFVKFCSIIPPTLSNVEDLENMCLSGKVS